MTLDKGSVITKAIMKPLQIQFDYSLMNEVMIILKKYECEILNRDAGLFCLFNVAAPLIDFEQFVGQIKNMKGVEMKEL